MSNSSRKASSNTPKPVAQPIPAPVPPEPKEKTETFQEILLKWVTPIVTVGAVLILYADWLYTSAFYSTLGVSELAYSMFTRTPSHFMGVLVSFTEVLLLGFMAFVAFCIAWTVFSTFGQKLQGGISNDRGGIYLIYIVFYGLVLEGVVLSVGANLTFENRRDILMGIFTASALVLFFFYLLWREKKVPIGLSVFGVGVVLLVAFVHFSLLTEHAGKKDGLNVMDGKTVRYLGVMAVMDRPFTFPSDEIGSLQKSEQSWIYWSKQSSVSTSLYVPSLQYIGADDTNAFFLDIPARLVHRVPKSSISELIFFNPDRNAGDRIQQQVDAFISTLPTPAAPVRGGGTATPGP